MSDNDKLPVAKAVEEPPPSYASSSAVGPPNYANADQTTAPANNDKSAPSQPPANGSANGSAAPRLVQRQPRQQVERVQDELSAAFFRLKIPDITGTVRPDEHMCIAHLKLLHAIDALKQDVGYTDGLFGLWDASALKGVDLSLEKPNAAAQAKNEEARMALSRIREKRWALYVARAVDRYEAWWNSMPIVMLTEEAMKEEGSYSYESFGVGPLPSWKIEDLPPLDVLMVWHTHCLNPRDYLEDCIRHGLEAVWHHGFPWNMINNAIDRDFNYNVAARAKDAWVLNTGRQWLNENDSSEKAVPCPFCKKEVMMPWTTCDKAQESKA